MEVYSGTLDELMEYIMDSWWTDEKITGVEPLMS